ncbi:MAG: hypothetical protein FJZ97_03830 [Chloroflexi bacterium]|nr:hypothetical protein [Chloroflexota bacterium]
MKPTLNRSFSMILLAGLLAACSLPSPAGGAGGPTPIPGGAAAPLPAAEVVFTVMPPAGTADDAGLQLLVLDDVTGLPYGARPVPMTRQSDGRWQARLTPPVGSLLRYRYVRQSPSASDEFDGLGRPVRLRLLHVTGPAYQDDLIAAWLDAPYLGSGGRIIGRAVDAASGQPLVEVLVSASGVTGFTDGEGAFRLDGLIPGLHTLVAVTTDGAHRPLQRQAIVAAESATPAELAMDAAPLVDIAFEVTLPEDTPPLAPVRVAGNVASLGAAFADLAGGVSASAGRMPMMVRVDATHALLLTQLYAGTDLRYKYTLGDGLWNAERDTNGAFVTRQLIVPEQGPILQDNVTSWRSPAYAGLTFRVSVPDNTPPTDSLSIQFSPFAWFEPLPMWKDADGTWTFVLNGPLDFGGPLTYRYCRNLQCGSADDIDTAGSATSGRSVTPSGEPQTITDTVRAWQWLPAETSTPTDVVAPALSPRPGFAVGYELLPAYRPSWSGFMPAALAEMAARGSNAVIFTPTWTLQVSRPLPILGLDPAWAALRRDVLAWSSQSARLGLQVGLQPALTPAYGTLSEWWSGAPRDAAWWAVWYESYRSFILTQARLAAEAGASSLILGGAEIAPALPDGRLADGSPSGAPADADARWRTLIGEVRGVFTGRIGFRLDLGESLQPTPSFIEAVDDVHLAWAAPLTPGGPADVQSMQATAAGVLDRTIQGSPILAGKPIVLHVTYASVEGGARACPPAPDGACRGIADFDLGAAVDPDLPVDLEAQAQAYNALLLEAASRQAISGFYAARTYPVASLLDKSASTQGKPAQEILTFWYLRLTGR